MCGIAGIQGALSGHSFKNILKHRGPDSCGEKRERDIYLYHSRLSILDLSESANQPMSNEDGTLSLVFNGEIYNFRELRKELEAKGHKFLSSTDSEVILHLYEECGDKLLSRVRGMFAFAIYDRKKEELFIARDPLGIKPLVYAEFSGSFVFGSELRALTDIPEFPREVNPKALELYFRLNYIPAPLTIWKHAKKLRPGYFLKVKKGKITEEKKYFELTNNRWQGNLEEAKRALHEKLKESVTLHLASDVPLGSFLSGGLDSSLVVALAQESLGKALKTFTVTFPEYKHYDESVYARLAAKKIGTDHTEIPVSAKDALEVFSEIVEHLDEPFADSSIVPSALINKVTRKHVKVALSGDGGDELFAGYTKYQGMRLIRMLKGFSPLVHGLAKLPFPENRTNPFGDRVRQLRKLSRSLKGDSIDELIGTMSVFSKEETAALMKGANYESGLKKRIAALSEEGRALGYSGINLALYIDTNFELPYDMFFKVDTASSRYGLEVRVPIVDTEVAKLAFSFPEEWKLKGFSRKWILNQIAAKYLPEENIKRPKKGFSIPIGEWMRKELHGTFKEALSPKNLEKIGIIDNTYVTQLFKEHMEYKKDRFWELWNLFVLSKWWDKYV